MKRSAIGDEIIAREREALDRWSAGDPAGYLAGAAEDVSYFDDIGAQRRIDGADAVRSYLSGLEGAIPPHDYEVEDPRVQVYGDVAVLTLRYAPSKDGEPLQPWKMSAVYRRMGDDWRVVHAHWSMAEDPAASPSA